MARIKAKEIRSMSQEDRNKKLGELKLELVKAKVASAKTGSSKAKEIRKLVARIMTINRSQEGKK